MRALRLPTLVAVSVLCIVAMFNGWRVFSFSLAETALDPGKDRVAQLAGWHNSVGVAASARRPSGLTVANGDKDRLAKLERQLDDYLAVAPTSTSVWLQLAQTRYANGEGAERASAALSMSQLTGPYESYVMNARAALGLLIWADLPDEVKSRTARDLALADLDTSTVLPFRILLKQKPDDVRDDVVRRLSAVEGLPADRLEVLGLD